MSLVVGLTGGVGSGKSTVSKLFSDHGVRIIDTDVIAHRLTQADGVAMPAIRAAFGDGYIANDGSLDRAKMRGLVFFDAAARQKLERILHPLILEQSKLQLQQMHDEPYVMLVVPLLPESPAFLQLVRRVLVVDCDEATQVARVIERGRMTEAEVRAVIAQQTPRARRLQLADDVIHNDAGVQHLARQVEALHARYSANS